MNAKVGDINKISPVHSAWEHIPAKAWACMSLFYIRHSLAAPLEQSARERPYLWQEGQGAILSIICLGWRNAKQNGIISHF